MVAELAAGEESVKAHEGVDGLDGVPVVGYLVIDYTPGVGDDETFALVAAMAGFNGYVRVEDYEFAVGADAFDVVRVFGESAGKVADEIDKRAQAIGDAAVVLHIGAAVKVCSDVGKVVVVH